MADLGDAPMWFSRLETMACVEIGVSMFTCLGAPEQSYNVALGFFVLWSALQRVGRINLLCMQLCLLSCVADVLALATRSDSWARQGALTSLALALLILLLFIKAVLLIVMVVIHGELRGDMTGAVGFAAAMSGQQQPRLSRSGSFGGAGGAAGSFAHAPHTPGGSFKQQSRSGSFGNVQMLAGHGGSTRSLHGADAEQHALLGGQQQRGLSPAPSSGSFRQLPVAQPAPAVAAHSFQAE